MPETRSEPVNRFLFATCQADATRALKEEAKKLLPQARLAYSRPGFVTWKIDEGVADGRSAGLSFSLPSIFAQTQGFSLGRVEGESNEDRLACVRSLLEAEKPDHVHAWGLHDEAALSLSPLLEALKKSHRLNSGLNAAKDLGARVFDIVALTESEWWVGRHQFDLKFHRPWPGGQFPLKLPAEAPSRAYLKLEEALQWAKPPVKSGQSALELGCAPGGASLALLRRGLSVVGVDPGDMAAVVSDFSAGSVVFRHLRMQALQAQREELGPIDWLVSDMNVPPAETFKAVAAFQKKIGKSLRGVVLTLKMKDWAAASEIETWQKRLRELGFSNLKMAHLSNNRTEICAVAWNY